jgi:hypothetical protein
MAWGAELPSRTRPEAELYQARRPISPRPWQTVSAMKATTAQKRDVKQEQHSKNRCQQLVNPFSFNYRRNDCREGEDQ